jgi:mRNA-degrading endonuclease RelE of RelBE toxin-antitoxin system
MSYALDFAPEARRAWRDLDVNLQELALDELDRLAQTCPSIAADLVHDVSVELQGAKHYLFFRLTASGTNLTVLNVGHYARPL